MICFHCGLYGHLQGSCPATCQSSNVDEHSVSPITKQQLAEECSFGPWMMVERKQRKPLSKQNDPSNSSSSPFLQGSRFNLLSDAINGDGNAPAIPSEPLADVPIHQVRSAASIPRAKPRSKGKMHVSSKPVKSVSLRKTLVFNFFDFSVLARNPNRASSSNIPPLDPTKHMAVVVDENLDPNIGVLPATSPMSDHTPPIACREAVRQLRCWNNFRGYGDWCFLPAAKQLLRDYKLDLVVFVEPRISGRRADSIIASLRFPHSHRVEAAGFSGGIWLAWYDSVSVDIISNHFQFIHCHITEKASRNSVYATAVYASPSSSRRKLLWPHLRRIANSMRSPWMLFGDFNAIICVDDRKGCRQPPCK
ncbi:hypothetical protein V6N13_135504 [Hibiscus sabdariffa]